MELILLGYYMILLLVLFAPVLAPLCLLIGAVVVLSSRRGRRSAPTWSAFTAYAAVVSAYWAYGDGLGHGGFGLLEKDEACSAGGSGVLGVEDSFLPPSFRCRFDDGTVQELVPASAMPLALGFLTLAVVAGALTVAQRRRGRRRARAAGSLRSTP